MEGFKNSDLYHKSNLLKQQADYLLTIQLDDGSVKLYSWERFFIEEYLDDEQQAVCPFTPERATSVSDLEYACYQSSAADAGILFLGNKAETVGQFNQV